MDRSPDRTTRNPSVIARHRSAIIVVGVVAVAALIPAVFTGRMWLRSTHADAYQIERIQAEAEALLPQLEGMNVSDRWMAMLALVKHGDLAAVKASRIGNPYSRIEALRLVATTLAKAGLTSQAEEVAALLRETARPLLERVSEIKDPIQQVTALQTITRVLAEAGLAEAAGEAAQQTLTTALSMPDAGVRSATLITVAAELARLGRFLESKRAALEIKDPAQRLNALTKIASTLRRAGPNDRIREIEQLAREAATSARETALQEQNLTKRGRALASIALDLAQAKVADQARETAFLIEDPSIRAEAFRSLAVVLSENALSTQGKDAAFQIKEAAIKIVDPRQRWRVLVSTTYLLVKFGATDQAREAAMLARSTAFQVKEEPMARVSTLGETAVVLAEAGLPEPARETAILARDTAIQIQNPPVRSKAIGHAIRGLARSGAIDEAEESARSVMEAALQLPDPSDQAAALKSLIFILVGNGLIAIAQDFAREIEDPQQRLEALSMVLEALSRAGLADRVREAEILVREAALQAGEIEDEDPQQRLKALSMVMEALSRAGLADRVREVERLVRKAALQIEDPTHQSAALLPIATNLAKLDRPDEASQIAESMQNPVSHSGALAEIAKSLARKHRFYDARLIADSCEQASDRLDAFTTILGEHAKITQAQLARWIDELETQPAAPNPAQSGSPNAR
jgi:hypothetical protein